MKMKEQHANDLRSLYLYHSTDKLRSEITGELRKTALDKSASTSALVPTSKLDKKKQLNVSKSQLSLPQIIEADEDSPRANKRPQLAHTSVHSASALVKHDEGSHLA
jgi:hypothetical protein